MGRRAMTVLEGCFHEWEDVLLVHSKAVLFLRRGCRGMGRQFL
jgi:hypothetical protein